MPRSTWSVAQVSFSLAAAACGQVSMPADDDDDVGVDAAPAGDACVPVTCAAAGAECGTIADGCGGTVECSGCGTGEVCGIVADRQCAPAPTPKLRNG